MMATDLTSNCRGVEWYHPILKCSQNLALAQKLDECSLAHARKIFASARMLGF